MCNQTMRAFYFLILTFVLSSCSVPVTLSLFNNTGFTQTITLGDKSINVKSGEHAIFKSIEYSTFIIQASDTVFTYSIENLSLSNIVWTGWGPFSKRIFYVQLESDGKIWATSSKNNENNFDSQPEGFPLAPRT